MSERPPDDPAARIEQAAAEWFFLRDGGFTPDQSRAFAEWLRADRRHLAAFAEIDRTWARLAETRPQPARAAAEPGARRRRVRWRSVGLAAAAVLALLAWGGRASWLNRAAFAEQAATEAGGLRKLDLPDGSFVTLNADSSVDVQFTAAARQVRLRRGEAHFEVAKDPARPFVVEAAGVAVKAVGTAFSVSLRPAAVDVLVTEGRVRVDATAGGASLLSPAPEAAQSALPLLVAGKRATIALRPAAPPAPARITAVAAAEIDHALAWKNRRLDYADAPLSEIVADFNRHNQHKLVVADPRLAERRFGGSFPAGDYTSLVQLLEQTFGVVVERRDRETWLRLP